MQEAFAAKKMQEAFAAAGGLGDRLTAAALKGSLMKEVRVVRQPDFMMRRLKEKVPLGAA